MMSVIGTLGLLLSAKRQNLLSSVRPCLEALQQYDFRIAPALQDRVLSDADENV